MNNQNMYVSSLFTSTRGVDTSQNEQVNVVKIHSESKTKKPDKMLMNGARVGGANRAIKFIWHLVRGGRQMEGN